MLGRCPESRSNTKGASRLQVLREGTGLAGGGDAAATGERQVTGVGEACQIPWTCSDLKKGDRSRLGT
eukprot:503346-Hanusia_phi.AAC.1